MFILKHVASWTFTSNSDQLGLPNFCHTCSDLPQVTGTWLSTIPAVLTASQRHPHFPHSESCGEWRAHRAKV